MSKKDLKSGTIFSPKTTQTVNLEFQLAWIHLLGNSMTRNIQILFYYSLLFHSKEDM